MRLPGLPLRRSGRSRRSLDVAKDMKALDHLEFTQVVRCYNGAYDSASQRVLDNQKAVLAAVCEVEQARAALAKENSDD